MATVALYPVCCQLSYGFRAHMAAWEPYLGLANARARGMNRRICDEDTGTVATHDHGRLPSKPICRSMELGGGSVILFGVIEPGSAGGWVLVAVAVAVSDEV